MFASAFVFSKGGVGRTTPELRSAACLMTSLAVSVIIPAAGGRRSSVAPPTWLLQRPGGELVIDSVIRPLDLSECGLLAVVVLQSDLDEYFNGEAGVVERHLRREHGAALPPACAVRVLALGAPTTAAVDTVCTAISELSITGPIFVKDCDGAFPHKIKAGNAVAALNVKTANVNSFSDLPGMSFVSESGRILTNICEKLMISNVVCVGGYGFESAHEFVNSVQNLKEMTHRSEHVGGPSGRMFTSHVILNMVLGQEKVFFVTYVDSFDDWKTVAAWNKQLLQSRNWVVPLEGALATPLPTLHYARMCGKPLAEQYAPNVDRIDDLKSRRGPRDTVIVLTSRHEKERIAVEALLHAFGVPFDVVVYGATGRSSVVMSSDDAPRSVTKFH